MVKIGRFFYYDIDMEYILRMLCCIHFDDVNSCDDDYVEKYVRENGGDGKRSVVVIENYYG